MHKRLMQASCIVLFLLLSTLAAAQAANPSDALETVGPGTINWTSGEVYATGIGAPPAKTANPAQARAMAVRAAQVVAYRNLLEVVKGVRVDSETVVENFMTKSDVIRTSVEGIVKGARIVDTRYLSDGSVEMTLAMPMKGAFMSAIVPQTFGAPVPSVPAPPTQWQPSAKQTPPPAPPKPQPAPPAPEKRAEPIRPEPPKQEPAKPAPQQVQPQPEKKPEPPRPEPSQPAPSVPATDQSSLQFKGGKATGLVIDGRGLGLRPALLPKIVDPQGQEIYVGQVVTRTNAVEQGVAGYAKDVNAAANNFRVTDNPAVLKGTRASGAARTDVMLGQADAQMLRDLGKKGDFLQYCRVIIVY